MAKTLNAIAWDSAGKSVSQSGEIDKQASKDMDFNKRVPQAMGFRVRPTARATREPIEAVIWSDRGWLAYHLEDGQRKPSDGWRFNGKRYILVPVEPSAFTKSRKLKSGYRRGIYIVPKGKQALMFHRPKKKGSKSNLIGVLSPQVKHNEDTEPDRVINRVFREKAARLFNYYLDQE